MAGRVFFSVSMSLDGFIAPASLGELVGQQWMELQQWVVPPRFFRENLTLGEGGEGRDTDIVRSTFDRTGASLIGKRLFAAGGTDVAGESAVPHAGFRSDARSFWPLGAAGRHHVPLRHRRFESPWTRPARPPATGTSASPAAAKTILEYLIAGSIDEFSIALSPVLVGSGIRLFEGVDAGRAALEKINAESSQRVTHLTYAVRER